MQREDINSNTSTISPTVVYVCAIVGLLTTRSYNLYASLFPLGAILQNLIRSYVVDAFRGCGSCTVEIGPNTRRGQWERDVREVICRNCR